METDFFLTIAAIWIVAVITPGPNFFITVQIAAGKSLCSSLFAVLGIVAGTFIWATCGYLGISVLFKMAPLFYFALKTAGGLYLIWVGITFLFRSKDKKAVVLKAPSSFSHSFQRGVFTNLLNPKTAMFMTGLFAAAVPQKQSVLSGIFSVVLICSISAVWYSLVAWLFSGQRVKTVYDRCRDQIEKIAGTVFILFGLKLISAR